MGRSVSTDMRFECFVDDTICFWLLAIIWYHYLQTRRTHRHDQAACFGFLRPASDFCSLDAKHAVVASSTRKSNLHSWMPQKLSSSPEDAITKWRRYIESNIRPGICRASLQNTGSFKSVVKLILKKKSSLPPPSLPAHLEWDAPHSRWDDGDRLVHKI